MARIVLIAGFESFNIELYRQASELAIAIVYVEQDGYIRIVSARKATLREIKLYDQG
jgi:uncharacterized DUF497 family protein